MFRFVIKPNYLKMFVGLAIAPKGKKLMQMSKETGMNYPHLTIVIRQFHQEGLIEKDTKSKEVLVKLTEKGKQIAEHLAAIKNIMEDTTEPEKPTEPETPEEDKGGSEDGTDEGK